MISNIPDAVKCEIQDDNVKFIYGDLSTDWMSDDDSFVKRIDESNLNPVFLKKHLVKEFEIRNSFEEGISLLKAEKYSKSIEKFDEVLFYDLEYGEVLLNKSFALCGQKHYVKSLRTYRKAIKADDNLKDIEYHKKLIKMANEERDNFPKIKLNIYAGDEHFAKGEFEKAIESYDKALANPSRFKDTILSKLLNKKATALLRLDEFEKARNCFKKSIEGDANDYATFGEGICDYNLGLNISEGFKVRLDIAKAQMLRQVQILNDLGFYSESLDISDYLWRNHFRVDDFYIKLAQSRKSTMEKLGMDTAEPDMFID